MDVVAIAARPFPRGAPDSTRRRKRGVGVWVLAAVPIVLVLAVCWQLAASLLHTEAIVRSAVSVSRVSLEPDPVGARVDVVLGDRVGNETSAVGSLTIKVREPDGTLWQTTRGLTTASFTPLQSGGLLAGRVGYSVSIPTSDWLRAPRHGGLATVTVSMAPAEGAPFSTEAEERFP